MREMVITGHEPIDPEIWADMEAAHVVPLGMSCSLDGTRFWVVELPFRPKTPSISVQNGILLRSSSGLDPHSCIEYSTLKFIQ